MGVSRGGFWQFFAYFLCKHLKTMYLHQVRSIFVFSRVIGRFLGTFRGIRLAGEMEEITQ